MLNNALVGNPDNSETYNQFEAGDYTDDLVWSHAMRRGKIPFAVFEPSRNEAQALYVLRQMRERGWIWTTLLSTKLNGSWQCVLADDYYEAAPADTRLVFGDAPTLALAICRACLAAADWEIVYGGKNGTDTAGA